MFERYTESARRTLFFARHESSHSGATTITSEHLLLGLIRDRKGVVATILRDADVSCESLVRELAAATPFRERVSTAVEIPFSPETKNILQLAMTEADDLNHKHIGPEHLLLGLLQLDETPAASILHRHGLTLQGARAQVARLSKPDELSERSSLTPEMRARAISILRASENLRPGIDRDIAAALEALENLKPLVERLAGLSPEDPSAPDLLAAILKTLDEVRRRLSPG
jgi:ATP-dependent Clp protease ATP-binding subunit ClpC